MENISRTPVGDMQSTAKLWELAWKITSYDASDKFTEGLGLLLRVADLPKPPILSIFALFKIACENSQWGQFKSKRSLIGDLSSHAARVECLVLFRTVALPKHWDSKLLVWVSRTGKVSFSNSANSYEPPTGVFKISLDRDRRLIHATAASKAVGILMDGMIKASELAETYCGSKFVWHGVKLEDNEHESISGRFRKQFCCPCVGGLIWFTLHLKPR